MQMVELSCVGGTGPAPSGSPGDCDESCLQNLGSLLTNSAGPWQELQYSSAAGKTFEPQWAWKVEVETSSLIYLFLAILKNQIFSFSYKI